MSEPATPDRSRRPPPSRRLTISELTLLRARQELLVVADTGPSGQANAANRAVAISEIDIALQLMADRPIDSLSRW